MLCSLNMPQLAQINCIRPMSSQASSTSSSTNTDRNSTLSRFNTPLPLYSSVQLSLRSVNSLHRLTRPLTTWLCSTRSSHPNLLHGLRTRLRLPPLVRERNPRR